MVDQEKAVLVTGAANGLGLSISKYLAERGFRIFAADIDKEALSKLDEHEFIEPIFMDVTSDQSVKEAIDCIKSKTEGLDGLVNNAGLICGGPLVEIDPSVVQKVFDVNILGVVRVTRAAFPLLQAKKGRIINMGSEAGRLASPFNGPYSMSKFALEAYSDSLRRELLRLGIKVVHLQVGAMRTSLLNDTPKMFHKYVDLETSSFRRELTVLEDFCTEEVTRGSDPIHVAKTVYKALRVKRPKVRYRVKNNKTRMLVEKLPSSVVDAGMKRIMR